MNNKEKEEFLDQQLDNLANQQEQELLIDFDEIIEEEKAQGLKIKFNKKIYTIPSKMPFSFAMFFFRNCLKTVKGKTVIQIPDHITIEFIERMFGEVFLKDLEESKIDISFQTLFEKFANKVLNNWGIDIESDETQKKIKEMKTMI